MVDIQEKVGQTPGEDSQKSIEEPQYKDATASFLAVDWELLVGQIKAGEGTGMAQLYKLFQQGIRYYLYRRVGPQEFPDKVHDTFLIVVEAIKKGNLREPERLMGFVRTVARRQVFAHIEKVVRTRHEQADLDSQVTVVDKTQNPEQEAYGRQKTGLMKSALEALSKSDREILMRFYLKEQSRDQICHDMELTETQFRLLKSRAKAKFARIGKKTLATAESVQHW